MTPEANALLFVPAGPPGQTRRDQVSDRIRYWLISRIAGERSIMLNVTASRIGPNLVELKYSRGLVKNCDFIGEPWETPTLWQKFCKWLAR